MKGKKPQFMEDICRACLKPSKILVDLYNTEYVTVPSMSLYDIFVQVTSVRLTPDEDSRICAKCKEELITADKFRRRVLESTERLRSQINIIKSETVSNEASDQSYRGSEIDEKSNGDGNDLELFQIKDTKALKRRKKLQSKDNRDQRSLESEYLSCRFCLKKYNKLSHKILCQRTHIANNMGIECHFCSKKFLTITSIRSHLSIHFYSSFSCNLCTLTFATENKLKYHVGYVHGNINQKYPCQVCGKGYSKRALQIHIQEVHFKETKFICDICSKGFSSRDKIRKHFRHVHFSTEIQCDVCQKILKNRISFKMHMKTIHSTNQDDSFHKCEICERSYKTLAGIRQHRSTHTERKISCPECGIVLQTKNSYKYHIKTHNKVRPHFQCPHCSKSFMTDRNLSDHVRLHSGELFSCDICGKEYTKRAQMVLHKQVSHEGKRFPCEHCGAVFARPNGVKRHIKDNCNKNTKMKPTT